jgi:hypothetical protein
MGSDAFARGAPDVLQNMITSYTDMTDFAYDVHLCAFFRV